VFCLGALTLCADALAGIEFSTVQNTTVPLPEGVRPDGKIFVDPEGEVFLITRSDEEVGFGTYIYKLELGGENHEQVIHYTHGDYWTQALSWTFGPEGDIAFRAVSVPPQEANLDPYGITIRMTRAGDIVWEVPDDDFAQQEEFIGRYEGPAGPIVYSPIAQRFLVFSAASFDIAPVSQGSLLFEFNGDVRDPSVVFGENYIGAELNNALATPDGKFLVFYFSANTRGTRFYRFDGIANIEYWQPEGGDWMNRRVYQLQFDPDQNVLILWGELDEEMDATKSKMTKLDAEGNFLWETDLAARTEVTLINPDTEEEETFDVALSRSVYTITATDEIVMIRPGEVAWILDVRSNETGELLGFEQLSNLSDFFITDFAFLNGTESEYLLTTIDGEDPTKSEMLQLKLEVNDDPVVITNNGANNSDDAGVGDSGSADVGNNEPDTDSGGSGQTDVGCDCSTTAPRGQWPAAFALFGMLLMLVARRRRSTPSVL
jgi:MYXO-CTERM domain-containing protein